VWEVSVDLANYCVNAVLVEDRSVRAVATAMNIGHIVSEVRRLPPTRRWRSAPHRRTRTALTGR
jgi:hypothetical protein